jgi:hypothetical protein
MPRGNRFTFTLKSSWKGVTTRTVDVTIFGVEGCGSRFDVGQEFLVYAYGESSDFVTGMCSRTAPISAAAADLRYLSTLTTLPLPGATGWQSYVGLFAWIGGAALALASLELWRRRRPG